MGSVKMKLIVIVFTIMISMTSGAVLLAPLPKPIQSEYRQLALFKKGFFAVGLIPTFQRMEHLISSLKKPKKKFNTVTKVPSPKRVRIFRAPFDVIGKFSA